MKSQWSLHQFSSAVMDAAVWSKTRRHRYPHTPPPAHVGDPEASRPTERHCSSSLPGSFPGSPSNRTSPEHLSKEVARRHWVQTPQPPLLPPLEAKEQHLYYKLPWTFFFFFRNFPYEQRTKNVRDFGQTGTTPGLNQAWTMSGLKKKNSFHPA